MTLTIDAVYENGVLKPSQPLPLKEHQTVRVTLQSGEKLSRPSQPSLARQTAGMIPWIGDAETLEKIACDPEYGIMESP